MGKEIIKRRSSDYFKRLFADINKVGSVSYKDFIKKSKYLDRVYLGEEKSLPSYYALISFLKREGKISVEISSKDGREKFIKISPKIAKEISREIVIDFSSTETEEKKKEEKKSLNFKESYLRFITGGILVSKGESITVNTIVEKINKGFGLKVDPKELELVISQDPNNFVISFLKEDAVIELKSKDSWENIKKAYHPKNFEIEILVRINSMSKEEIEKFFSKASTKIEVISKFRESDCIYLITINESVESKRLFLRFIKFFRKDDKVLNKSQEDFFQKLLEEEDSRAYKYYCPLEIENL